MSNIQNFIRTGSRCNLIQFDNNDTLPNFSSFQTLPRNRLTTEPTKFPQKTEAVDDFRVGHHQPAVWQQKEGRSDSKAAVTTNRINEEIDCVVVVVVPEKGAEKDELTTKSDHQQSQERKSLESIVERKKNSMAPFRAAQEKRTPRMTTTTTRALSGYIPCQCILFRLLASSIQSQSGLERCFFFPSKIVRKFR